MYREKIFLDLKKRLRFVFFLILGLSILFVTGCEKREQNITQKIEDEEVKERNKDEQKEIGTVSNNPYNLLTYYEDGFTYIKNGNTISRVGDDSDNWEDIYTHSEATGMAFVGHEGALYVYNLLSEEALRTEIIKINMDGSNPQKLLIYDGLVAGIYFEEDIVYLNGYEDGTSCLAVYEFQNGIIGQRISEKEKPANSKVDDYFQTDSGLMYTPFGDFLISPQKDKVMLCNEDGEEQELYGLKNGEQSVQLFTYDEAGVYICAFKVDDGTVYRISRDTKEVREMFKLQDVGVEIQNRNIEVQPIYINVQKGYAYIWDAADMAPIRHKLES